VLSRSVDSAKRTAAFARYSLVGALAGAIGGLAAASPDLMARAGVAPLVALKAMFFLYAALGLAAALLYRGITSTAGSDLHKSNTPLGPSRRIVYKLAALFSIDSFAGGFAVQSLLALWLFSRFGLSLSEAGFFFLWSGILSAFSFPVASWLAGRIGLVNTMVFTHIPSSLCLIAAAISPNLDIALALLLVRSALSQMDVPTRSSYVMAVVTPSERAAAASFTSVPRSLAAAASPALAGALYAAGYGAWPFIICGVLKILYDLLLLWTFRHVRPPEEQVRC
jgi:predicted MFS family arabinose efflux permease